MFINHLSTASIRTLLALALSMTTLVLTGCQTSASKPPVADIQPELSQQTLTQQALQIQQALANKNYNNIIDEIHPTRGVRFSMYAYVRPEKDKRFSREEFAQYLQQSRIRFTWGELDGTGELFVKTLPNYLETWVGGSKFNEAIISVNKFKGSGNSINNLNKIYEKSDFVEFYYNGSERYSGIDWQALRLVFDEYQGKRYLVAIVSDRSTV